MKRLVNFLFEAGMLRRTPRSGFAFLGSGAESVAEHSFRTTCIAFALGRLHGGVDTDRLIRMCLFHDLPEARMGDLNYVNKKYVTADESSALRDLTADLPFAGELKALLEEFNAGQTEEAVLARDADQIDLLLSLKETRDIGNPRADDWVPFVLERIQSEPGRELARIILKTDSTEWWFADKGDWWVNGGRSE